MIKQVQSSFRRILLSRILLITVPVLILGQYIIYRKARSTLLDTARQNLKESADRKAENIQQWAKSLESNLINASESYVLQSGQTEEYQKYVEQLYQMLPNQVRCVQLSNLQTSEIIANTCDDQSINSPSLSMWPLQQKQLVRDMSNISISYIWPEQLNSDSISSDDTVTQKKQVSLGLSVPVYVAKGSERQLRYALSIRSDLPMQTNRRRGSLAGSTVVIDYKGTILASPDPDRVGGNISDGPDAERLKSIIRNAQEGRKDFAHIFSFEEIDVSKNSNSNSLREFIDEFKKILPELLGLKLSADDEFLVGYAPTSSPVDRDEDRQWIVLAITPIDFALSGLREVQKVLIIMIFGLVAASVMATIYLARDLARPLEKLRDYAFAVNDLDSPNKVPRTIKIREFNQLAIALERMVYRLKRWADQLEITSKEAQVANQLKSEFLANISHELRTPLNGIIGSIQLIYDGFCDTKEEEMEFLKQANDSAIHLLGIIDDILDIRRIDSETLSIYLKDVDIGKLLHETIDSFREYIAQKSLLLKLNIPEQVIIVNADEEKLKQVFENVIGNAIKFTEKGSINIYISQEYNNSIVAESTNNSSDNYRGKEDQVLVKIEDTGIGISPEEQDKLFQPFVMVDGTKTRKFGGNGLGLAISRGLMEMMNGSIHLYSEGVDLGTTVDIMMPIKEKQAIKTEVHLNSQRGSRE
ncbi:MAG: HAMP domain-containing histidine kinase [Okeania sp. SIO3B5]|uniref:sensor histidine kinase n=1 Tax=Okeania sp. SIO3B5 TaxID=2607811 RepID=UPI00140104B9|nr:HAMP domain-containing sensor histidine kinase [Okeania sp. SIO3B5]NEO57135.1 HAMP domain-containing histidine kinase [Okeania sp. SIO3B5]